MKKVQNVKKSTLLKVVKALGFSTAEELYYHYYYDENMLPVEKFIELVEKSLKIAYKNLEKAKNPIEIQNFYAIEVDNNSGAIDCYSESECAEVVNNISNNIKYVEKLLKKYRS